jgi:hydroxypyruvate reductase
VIASGETTVTVRGQGRGGRNQEFVLGAAAVLANHPAPALLVSVGTDGTDGPTDAAGAVVDSTTLVRAGGQSIARALEANDAYPLLARLGDLVKWGPTFTNVGDLHILITMCP